tara:strand:- start:1248 stop:1664 length:417 start_codon:yes stop_codon:yes gene_type:complete
MFDGLISTLNQYQSLLVWLGIGSSVCFALSLIAIPMVIKRLPADYFVTAALRQAPATLSFRCILVSLCKNLVGLSLILAGLVMLITPGQGILTIIVGILLGDFPGKLRFERWLIAQAPVKQSLNWIRRKQKLADFIIE